MKLFKNYFYLRKSPLKYLSHQILNPTHDYTIN